MSSGVTIDTNILIYAIDSRNAEKHRRAATVVGSCLDAHGIIPLQALSEFFRAVTRKGLLPDAEAASFVESVRRATSVVASSEDDLAQAMTAHRRHKLQFFDALLLATVRRAGCTVLLSEDMQHERTYDGVQVLNPFLLSAADLRQFTL